MIGAFPEHLLPCHRCGGLLEAACHGPCKPQGCVCGGRRNSYLCHGFVPEKAGARV